MNVNKQKNELTHNAKINDLKADSDDEVKGAMSEIGQADALPDLEPEGEVVGGALKGKPQHLVDSWTQHNETLAGDEDEESQLADLRPTELELNETRGGHGVTVLAWARVDGTLSSNHNEIVVEDENEETQLADLRPTEVELDGTKGGPGVPFLAGEGKKVNIDFCK